MDVLLDTYRRRGVKPLLLIYLFAVKAAADCPKPHEGENIVLTNEALLMNDFPEGSKADLECANGYVRESGSGTITCTGGTWTEPDLTCKKKDCGPPKPKPNMSFNISNGTLFGAVAIAVCDKGYQITGSAYKQCFATGWTGRAKCEIVTCNIPAELTNGRMSWNSQDYPKYGDIIRYSCDEGYTLIGKDNIVCSETGQYDSQPPECKRVTTDDRVRAKMVTSTPPAQEASTSTDSSGTPTAHRDKTITTSATPTVSPSVQGGRGILKAMDTTTSVTSMTLSSFQDMNDVAVDTNNDTAYTAVIVSVIFVLLAALIVVFCLHKFLLRRKGSAIGTVHTC